MTNPTTQLDETKDLGTAMLIAEAEDGSYEPITLAGSIHEAREIAQYDRSRRLASLQKGVDVLCPAFYKLWSRTSDGSFATLLEIPFE